MATDVAVAVLFALEREAAPFRRRAWRLPRVSVHVTGVGPDQARRVAERVVAEQVPGLVVAAGFCGALVPDLRVGDIVSGPRLVTVGQLVSDPADKRRLAGATGAAAVDMESAAVAAVCAARGVPFRAVRAVSDTLETPVSPELVRLLAGGRVSVLRLTAAVVRRPGLLGGLGRLARDTRIAAEALARELVRLLTSPAGPKDTLSGPRRSLAAAAPP